MGTMDSSTVPLLQPLTKYKHVELLILEREERKLFLSFKNVLSFGNSYDNVNRCNEKTFIAGVS